jgi:uncharacterized phage protein (TIGR02220 family)
MKEYFSHDYYAREDEKIKNLMYAHKWNGYGIYWAIIEMLYQNNGYMQLHYNRIAFELRTEETIIDSIINDFDLFKIKGDKFTSESVLRRLKMREEKSDIYKSNALKRWGSVKKKDATAMQLHSNSNAIKEKEIKEKEIINNYDFILRFNELTGKKLRVFDKKSKSQFEARLKEGFTTDDIETAIKNCLKDKFHIENRQYLTPEFITRADKLQKYLNSNPGKQERTLIMP